MVLSSPAVVDGVVYVGSYDDNVYALDAFKGGFIWNYTTGGDVSSSPAVLADGVFGGSYALDASGGAFVWSYLTGDMVVSSPAVYDGTVYVGSYDHFVYAFGSSLGSQPSDSAISGWVLLIVVSLAVLFAAVVLAVVFSTRKRQA